MRERNYGRHVPPRTFLLGTACSQSASGHNHISARFHFSTADRARNFARAFRIQLTSVFGKIGACSCVSCTAVPKQELPKSTDRICARVVRSQKSSKNNCASRTGMSVELTASAFTSAISPSSHGHRRPRRTFHSSPATTRAPAADGLPATQNHPLKRSASSSRRSCGDFISGRSLNG